MPGIALEWTLNEAGRKSASSTSPLISSKPVSGQLPSSRRSRIEEHRSSFVASSRVDLRYFGHLPWIRNRFSARSYRLESTFMLVP